jgi:hypothetical protein
MLFAHQIGRERRPILLFLACAALFAGIVMGLLQ